MDLNQSNNHVIKFNLYRNESFVPFLEHYFIIKVDFNRQILIQPQLSGLKVLVIVKWFV